MDEEGVASTHDRRLILTVGYTLILDLQVLVCSWARVGEDVRTSDHNALGSIVASSETIIIKQKTRYEDMGAHRKHAKA